MKNSPIEPSFSATKNLATLLLMTTRPQREIGKIVGVSHEQVRFWHHQKKVKEIRDAYCRKYASFFFDYWLEKGRKYVQDLALYKKGAEAKPIPFGELKDAHLYSLNLANAIIKEYNARIPQYQDAERVPSIIIHYAVRIAIKQLRKESGLSCDEIINLKVMSLRAIMDLEKILSELIQQITPAGERGFLHKKINQYAIEANLGILRTAIDLLSEV
jgi:hypothetical protein